MHGLGGILLIQIILIFTVDCTNFVSQALRAGGAPMSGYPNRNKGWWITDGWRVGVKRSTLSKRNMEL